MSKRYGNLIVRIIERDNMYRAFDEVVDQLPERKKKLSDGRTVTVPGRRSYYRKQRERMIDELIQVIGDGTFRVTQYTEMEVHDGPKDRIVQSPCVSDRIGCNAIMRIVEDVLYPSVIKTSAASIPGRGMHHLFEKMRSDIEHDRLGTAYFYKCDIRKFFESINQDLMFDCIKQRIKDPVLLPILENFVRLMPHGLSIGLRSSQCYGNIILSDLDHYFKDVLGVRYYYRYCDDIVILASSKRKLWLLRDIMHEQAAKLQLQIKPNESVKPISEGIDFLGFVYDGEKARLRKRTKQKAARAFARVRSRRRRQEIAGSLKGMAKWGDCKHLYKTITGKNMESFAQLKKQRQSAGVEYTGKDGKRILMGKPENLRALVNMHITIIDFEPDVPTQNGPRYVVQFQKDDGTMCKYLTNDSEQKFWLEELRKCGKLPFDCNITPQFFGQGKVRYMFT
ncbi:MAG: hypothetical protein IKZ87_05365 [Actinomycetaceae bacterium]|nr:hypothetical protein [Actinomycetaceae bacterium]